jgi:hypothetical protein
MLARDLIALRCGPLARPIGAVAGYLFLVVTESQVHDFDWQPFALVMLPGCRCTTRLLSPRFTDNSNWSPRAPLVLTES